ncbi:MULTISPECIES: ketopantoate reductase family protein [unclassified Paenibacillus]|uniref:ketopantoate reductase family protein n=1 Tax=unclassified Paenibacillus TaxID=185978 RepID=UPI001AE432C2|nr:MULTISPECIES: ketopantoate reductase family protein [unclassified Paenibacillus]MBP1153781.1 2-dehydropantoate 2-reductase [Paenibacillus sp. PvP091]MBP1170834.1 2-dehydropantoate 2-reductase [Paenibacillus sp. PvR098]MBP2441862.1 2-dehydropantoate 2-reductase [Paenibacillus sp. PvP052]
MKKIERVSVIGLGAIGAAYTSRLQDMNPACVQVIADQERIQRYEASELTVNGKGYTFRYVSPDAETEPADLVIVAVKYEGLQQAIRDMRLHVGPHTIILSLLNGISSEEILASAYGTDNLLYAMCVAIDAVRDGLSIHFSKIGKICFGEKMNTTYSPNVQRVKELFEEANIPYEIPENMLHTMWWKFMINVGVNQCSAVLKAPYRVFQEIPEAQQWMADAMQEVIILSEKAGVHLSQGDMDNFIDILHQLSPEGKTSMLQDIEAGRKTEVEYLAGKVRELGQKYGTPTPINDMLYKMIRILEEAALLQQRA